MKNKKLEKLINESIDKGQTSVCIQGFIQEGDVMTYDFRDIDLKVGVCKDLYDRKNKEERKRFYNVKEDEMCVHQEMVRQDPSTFLSNPFYQICYDCDNYNGCQDYKPLRK